MKIQLRIILDGTESAKEVRLGAGAKGFIGRGQTWLKIDSKEASRTHCAMLWEKEKLWVMDLESSHGTFVNGARITKLAIGPGDTLGIGSAKIIIDSIKPEGDMIELSSEIEPAKRVANPFLGKKTKNSVAPVIPSIPEADAKTREKKSSLAPERGWSFEKIGWNFSELGRVILSAYTQRPSAFFRTSRFDGSIRVSWLAFFMIFLAYDSITFLKDIKLGLFAALLIFGIQFIILNLLIASHLLIQKFTGAKGSYSRYLRFFVTVSLILLPGHFLTILPILGAIIALFVFIGGFIWSIVGFAEVFETSILWALLSCIASIFLLIMLGFCLSISSGILGISLMKLLSH